VGIGLVPVTNKVRVHVSIERVVWFGVKDEAFVPCEIEVLSNVFYSFCMKKMRLVRELGALMYSK